jgi:hypothetical protein
VTREPQPTSAYFVSACITVTLAVTLAVLLMFSAGAQASKQAVDFFGGDGSLGGQFNQAYGGIAVNYTGAGPADSGDVYVTDPGNNRIQRFGRDDNGTPASIADDTYFFISAWGTDVDSEPSGGTAYEICTEASRCQAAVASAGNGGLRGAAEGLPPGGLALDQDTGRIYVTDAGNNRVNVYAGDGAFLHTFGYDVVASGPGDAGSGYEICAAAADICKAGLVGSGAGQIGATTAFFFSNEGAKGIAVSIADGNPATGDVYLADPGNRRVNAYGLDGSSPASFGSGRFTNAAANEPTAVAVDSRGIVYVAAGGGGVNSNEYRIERYDSQNANGGGVGFLSPILSPQSEIQRIDQSATAGQFRLSFQGETTVDLPYNAKWFEIEPALEALPALDDVRISFTDFTTPPGFHTVTFEGALSNTDVDQLVVSNGTTPLTGSISVTTIFDGHAGLPPKNPVKALAVDPDTDGPGPDTDILYAERNQLIQQFGPLNPVGLTAPPGAVDETHGTSGLQGEVGGLAVEPATARLYATSWNGSAGPGVYVIDDVGPPPTATLDSIDNVTPTSADLHATIDPNGPPATRYRFEYVDDATFQSSGFTEADSTPEAFLGTQEDPQPIDFTLEPAPIGLDPNTEYHVRLLAGRKFATPVISDVLTFTTDPASPLAETVGAPVRTTTTAQLNGRVTPLGSPTSYHFEYGSGGPCSSNPCTSTPAMPAGSYQFSQLVAEEITGLQSGTTYHYRLVAEGAGPPISGGDMVVTTRVSDALPNQSDTYSGPSGSDRAWEQVSIGETSGNPVGLVHSFSDDGNRAVYGIFGGTPISTTGNFFSFYFAQRTSGGWVTSLITPPREQLAGSKWAGAYGPDDLSSVFTFNSGTDLGSDHGAIFRLTPDNEPELLFERTVRSRFPEGDVPFGVSADGSRTVAMLEDGPLDPANPAAAEVQNLYDISSPTPKLVSLLPGNVVGPCWAVLTGALRFQGSHWITDDGLSVFFATSPAAPCAGGPGLQLYHRDLGGQTTKLVSGPPLSGPDCGGRLIKATPAAAFLSTSSRLDSADLPSPSCSGGNDVYRYQIADGSLDCVTCVIPGFSTEVLGSEPSDIAVADDGSRVYFTSDKRLLPEAPPDGQRRIYRVEVGSGDLAYVGERDQIGTALREVDLSPDGTTLAFSAKGASLNPLGDVSDNGGFLQYYRYDDDNRSLTCVSCPHDGSPPIASVPPELHTPVGELGQPNRNVLSADGETLAFATATPLVGADQNTAPPAQSPGRGTDVYEWRDGRHVLVTDGLTSWPEDDTGFVFHPFVEGISPSGSDIYFTATAAYTPDAPDALRRLYDARIGGGIAFPKPPPPCPLEVCQGTPKGSPEGQAPGTSEFRGPGNPVEATRPRRCPKGKRRVRRKGRVLCVKRREASQKRRANR